MLINILPYLFLGIAPSIIWLLFYLRKDAHPEPNRMIIKVFLLGCLVAILAALVECIPVGITGEEIKCFLRSFFTETLPQPIGTFLYIFLIISIVEELFKYLVVKYRILKNQEFDEPTDAMLYMIIVALGFAALENVLYILPYSISEAVTLSGFRFIGAVFLHTLSSGIIGYFLAMSIFKPKKKVKLLLSGFTLAIILHGIFNYFIMQIGESMATINGKIVFVNQGLFISSIEGLIISLGLAMLFVLWGFRKLKKLKSVCEY